MTDTSFTPGYMEVTLRKLAAKKALKHSKARTREISFTLAMVRLLLHLVGFSSLTIAGFSLNITAGFVTGAVCCFVLSALVTGNTKPTDDGTGR